MTKDELKQRTKQFGLRVMKPQRRIEPLMREADELTRIFAATIRTIKKTRKKNAKQR